jgi:hypothetical protein
MVDALPSDFLEVSDMIKSQIATDTETSGLYADDGARVSTASIAFIAPAEDGWAEWANRWDNVTYGLETIVPGGEDVGHPPYEVYIASVAWPFDQGVEGPPAKPEHNGQDKLWPDAENLPEGEWRSLLLLLGAHRLTMHNAKFDLEKYRVGCRRWVELGAELEANTVWDTQNVNHLLWPLHPTSLKPTCARLFGQEWADEAQVVKNYLAKSKLPAGRWDLMPWDSIGKYADTDARITLMLELRQKWEIDYNNAGSWLHYGDEAAPAGIVPQDGVYDKIERRMRQMRVLYRMERRGLPYDEVGSRLAGEECRKRSAKVAEVLPFTPTPNGAKDYFFTDKRTSKGEEGQNLVPYSVTEKGAPQLTAEIVVRMIEDRVPFAREWGEFSRVSNAASMWYEGYADAMGTDGRIRTCFRQNGTRSSRVSVERINLQAIPQDYRLSEYSALDGIPTPRELIAAAVPEGWRIFELDLAQAELRVGAMFAQCKLMIEMIADDADLHTYTTKNLFPDIPESNPLFKSKWRQVGKRGNFSLGFGSGGRTFKGMVSKETGILLDDNEANRIVRDWNALYPEWGRAIVKHQRTVEKRQSREGAGWLAYLNGERRWFQEYEEAHKAFNQRVQGNLGQFGIDWMLRTEDFLSNDRTLYHHAERDGIGEVGLVLTIHDSQVLLLPDNEFGKELADKCADFGRELWKQMFPGIPGGVDYHEWMYAEVEA